VSRVLFRETRDTRSTFEVEGQSDRAIRGDLARAIVEAGWDLHELRTAAVSLEAIFLQLTSSENAKPDVATARAGPPEGAPETAKG
jgi:hypothetical protein